MKHPQKTTIKQQERGNLKHLKKISRSALLWPSSFFEHPETGQGHIFNRLFQFVPINSGYAAYLQEINSGLFNPNGIIGNSAHPAGWTRPQSSGLDFPQEQGVLYRRKNNRHKQSFDSVRLDIVFQSTHSKAKKAYRPAPQPPRWEVKSAVHGKEPGFHGTGPAVFCYAAAI